MKQKNRPHAPFVIRIKHKQKDPVTYSLENSTFGALELFFYNAKINSFIQPLKLLFGVFFFIFMGILFFYAFIKSDSWGKIYVLFIAPNIGFYFMEIMLFIDILSENRFIGTFKNWTLVFVFVIIPAVISLVFMKWYLAIIGTILFWFHTIVFMPKNIRKIES